MYGDLKEKLNIAFPSRADIGIREEEAGGRRRFRIATPGVSPGQQPTSRSARSRTAVAGPSRTSIPKVPNEANKVDNSRRR